MDVILSHDCHIYLLFDHSICHYGYLRYSLQYSYITLLILSTFDSRVGRSSNGLLNIIRQPWSCLNIHPHSSWNFSYKMFSRTFCLFLTSFKYVESDWPMKIPICDEHPMSYPHTSCFSCWIPITSLSCNDLPSEHNQTDNHDPALVSTLILHGTSHITCFQELSTYFLFHLNMLNQTDQWRYLLVMNIQWAVHIPHAFPVEIPEQVVLVEFIGVRDSDAC